MEKNKYVMNDLAARDPRSFKAWRAGQDDGRTKRYLDWAKRQRNLSEMDLVERYKETLWEGEVQGEKVSPSGTLLARLVVPAVGLLAGVLLVGFFA